VLTSTLYLPDVLHRTAAFGPIGPGYRAYSLNVGEEGVYYEVGRWEAIGALTSFLLRDTWCSKT
jgi:hypothetical protein